MARKEEESVIGQYIISDRVKAVAGGVLLGIGYAAAEEGGLGCAATINTAAGTLVAGPPLVRKAIKAVDKLFGYEEKD